MDIKPLSDRIVVKRVEATEATTAGGIVIPDTAQEKPQQGIVIAIGPGKRLDTGEITSVDVKVGDLVLFGKYSGSEIQIAGEEFVVMRETDLLAVLPGEETEEARG